MMPSRKIPKIDEKYNWTQHALFKLSQHGLSQSRIKRVIRHPDRIEEGIVENTIAVMQKAGNSKNKTEIWAMYVLKKIKPRKDLDSQKDQEKEYAQRHVDTMSPAQKFRMQRRQEYAQRTAENDKQVRIISAWRYPGQSDERDPIPQEIIDEVINVLGA